MTKRILLVDDDKDLVQAVSAVLESRGYAVAKAHNGTDALASIAARAPDLIVLDVMMDTDAEGFGVAYKLEGDAKTRQIPIILMSGFTDHMASKYDSFEFIQGRDWPCAKFMKKPVSMPELVATVGKLLAEADALRVAVA
jgi:DNA-binding response OmpR family regulator